MPPADGPRAPHVLRDPRRRAVVAAAELALLGVAGAVAYLAGGAPAAFGVVVVGAALGGLAWWAAASGEADAIPGEAQDGAEREDPPQLEETILTLRCGACGSDFELRDPGRRPLRATCAACGVESRLP